MVCPNSIDFLDVLSGRSTHGTFRTPRDVRCERVGWVERSETHRNVSTMTVDYGGACHRARIRATRWPGPPCALIAAGSTDANAAKAERRSITVVRAKARNLGTPFQIAAADEGG